MRVYRAKDYKDMSRKAANIISAQVIMKPNCVLGLATGSTPIGTYSQLVDWYKKGDLDFSEVTSVNLDEYKGLPRTNDQSYYYFMHQHLFDQVNIQVENTHLPNGMEPDSKKECDRYEALIDHYHNSVIPLGMHPFLAPRPYFAAAFINAIIFSFVVSTGVVQPGQRLYPIGLSPASMIHCFIA